MKYILKNINNHISQDFVIQMEYPQTIPISSPANEFFWNRILFKNSTDRKITIVISSSPAYLSYNQLSTEDEAITKTLEPNDCWDTIWEDEICYVTALTKNHQYYDILKMNLEVKKGYRVSLQQRHIDNPLYREITLYSWTQCICI